MDFLAKFYHSLTIHSIARLNNYWCVCCHGDRFSANNKHLWPERDGEKERGRVTRETLTSTDKGESNVDVKTVMRRSAHTANHLVLNYNILSSSTTDDVYVRYASTARICRLQLCEARAFGRTPIFSRLNLQLAQLPVGDTGKPIIIEATKRMCVSVCVNCSDVGHLFD